MGSRERAAARLGTLRHAVQRRHFRARPRRGFSLGIGGVESEALSNRILPLSTAPARDAQIATRVIALTVFPALGRSGVTLAELSPCAGISERNDCSGSGLTGADSKTARFRTTGFLNHGCEHRRSNRMSFPFFFLVVVATARARKLPKVGASPAASRAQRTLWKVAARAGQPEQPSAGCARAALLSAGLRSDAPTHLPSGLPR